jgi:hypothetical protein
MDNQTMIIAGYVVGAILIILGLMRRRSRKMKQFK